MEIEIKSDEFDNEKMIKPSSKNINEKDYQNVLNQNNIIFKNFYTYYYNKKGDPLIAIGPDIFFFICLFIVNIIFNFYLMKITWKYLHFFFKICGIIIILIQQSFYVLTTIINPGLPKKFYQIDCKENPKLYKFCKNCNFWYKKKTGTIHCFDCGVCIEGFDHHCPWTTKCIGKNNVNLFMGMIISIFLLFGYYLFNVFVSLLLLEKNS